MDTVVRCCAPNWCWVQIGYELLAAAGRADEATSLVDVAERKMWLNIAAKMFMTSPDGAPLAARWVHS